MVWAGLDAGDTERVETEGAWIATGPGGVFGHTVHHQLDMARDQIALERWPAGVRDGSVEHRGLHLELVLHSVDQFAVHVLVHGLGELTMHSVEDLKVIMVLNRLILILEARF